MTLPRRPGIDRSLVSLITVTYNSYESLRRLRRSVMQHTRAPFEWVIVDNGSRREETKRELDLTEREWATTYEGVKDSPRLAVMRLEKNLFFTAANNVALARAGGDVIVLLNPDAVVAPGWLESMLAVLEQPGVGVVGCVLTNELGQVVHAGAYGMGHHEGFGDPYDATEEYAKTRKLGPTGWITGALLMISREALTAVGHGLNPRYRHYHSDRVLCEEVRMHGYDVWMSSLVLTHSVGGAQL